MDPKGFVSEYVIWYNSWLIFQSDNNILGHVLANYGLQAKSSLSMCLYGPQVKNF